MFDQRHNGSKDLPTLPIEWGRFLGMSRQSDSLWQRKLLRRFV
jgi:hypothetical protein